MRRNLCAIVPLFCAMPPKRRVVVAHNYLGPLDRKAIKIRFKRGRVGTVYVTRTPPVVAAGDCSICLAPLGRTDTFETECHHQMHAHCLREWAVKHARTCPQCRAKIRAPPRPRVIDCDEDECDYF